jgi:ankyrin repeat protein/outer membrane protein assembly factor BamD (BamD/ComL family)
MKHFFIIFTFIFISEVHGQGKEIRLAKKNQKPITENTVYNVNCGCENVFTIKRLRRTAKLKKAVILDYNTGYRTHPYRNWDRTHNKIISFTFVDKETFKPSKYSHLKAFVSLYPKGVKGWQSYIDKIDEFDFLCNFLEKEASSLYTEASKSKLENLALTYFYYKRFVKLYEVKDSIQKQKLLTLTNSYFEVDDFVETFPEEKLNVRNSYLEYATNFLRLQKYIELYPAHKNDAKDKILNTATKLKEFSYCASAFPNYMKDIAQKAYNSALVNSYTEKKELEFLKLFPLHGKEIIEDRYYKLAIDIDTGKEYLNKYSNGRYKKEVDDLIERKYFEKAVSGNSKSSFKSYLDKYPNGKYKKDVDGKLKNFDDNAYNLAVKNNTIKAYKNYIKQYPNGIHTKKAEQKIKDLDKYAFSQVTRTNTIQAFEKYIKEHPNGIYVENAKQNINSLINTLSLNTGQKNLTPREAYLIIEQKGLDYTAVEMVNNLSEPDLIELFLISNKEKPIDFKAAGTVIPKGFFAYSIVTLGGFATGSEISIDKRKRYYKTLELLGDYGFDMDFKDKFGGFPLSYAIENDEKELVKILVTAGADADVSLENAGGLNPLCYYIAKNNYQMVEVLCANDADINYKSESYSAVDGAYALYLAKGNNQLKGSILELVCKYGPNLKRKFVTSEYSFLVHAVAKKDLPLINFLVEQGADIGLNATHHTQSPFYYSIEVADINIIKYFLNKGVNPNQLGGFPLVKAIDLRNKEIVKLLVKNGANSKMTVTYNDLGKYNSNAIDYAYEIGADDIGDLLGGTKPTGSSSSYTTKETTYGNLGFRLTNSGFLFNSTITKYSVTIKRTADINGNQTYGYSPQTKKYSGGFFGSGAPIFHVEKGYYTVTLTGYNEKDKEAFTETWSNILLDCYWTEYKFYIGDDIEPYKNCSD